MRGRDRAYVVIANPGGPPDTIDRAYPFVKDNIVTSGFLDIVLRPNDVFVTLLDRLDCSGSEVVLGLFPAHDAKATDMIDIDAAHCVRAVHLRPRATGLRYAWLCTVWMLVSTEFLHQFLHRVKQEGKVKGVGNRRIDAQGNIPVRVVEKEGGEGQTQARGGTFPTRRYIDIGTPPGPHGSQVRIPFSAIVSVKT